jgi:hypothetical protein
MTYGHIIPEGFLPILEKNFLLGTGPERVSSDLELGTIAAEYRETVCRN